MVRSKRLCESSGQLFRHIQYGGQSAYPDIERTMHEQFHDLSLCEFTLELGKKTIINGEVITSESVAQFDRESLLIIELISFGWPL